MTVSSPRWRERLGNPVVAGLVCSALLFPAHALGQEAAQALRRAIDHVVSRSDTLFAWATEADANADLVRSVQAWGAWILCGLIAGAVAMVLTRWLAGRALGWVSIAVVGAAWLAVYALVWDWTGELRFLRGGSLAEGMRSGPWPYAGFWGFFAGLIPALIVAASPWRAPQGAQTAART